MKASVFQCCFPLSSAQLYDKSLLHSLSRPSMLPDSNIFDITFWPNGCSLFVFCCLCITNPVPYFSFSSSWGYIANWSISGGVKLCTVFFIFFFFFCFLMLNVCLNSSVVAISDLAHLLQSMILFFCFLSWKFSPKVHYLRQQNGVGRMTFPCQYFPCLSLSEVLMT